MSDCYQQFGLLLLVFTSEYNRPDDLAKLMFIQSSSDCFFLPHETEFVVAMLLCSHILAISFAISVALWQNALAEKSENKRPTM